MTRLMPAALFAVLFGSAANAAEPKKPNVVFILANDLGWADLTPCGGTFHDTPNPTSRG